MAVETPAIETVPFQVPATDLKEAIRFAKRGVPKWSRLPILGCLLFVVEPGSAILSLYGTDVDTVVRSRVFLDRALPEGFRAAVEPAHLLAILDGVNEVAIPTAIEGKLRPVGYDRGDWAVGKLHVSTGDATYSLPLFNPGEFPGVPDEPLADAISDESFAEDFAFCASAASTDETGRALLLGVEINGDRLLAGDGSRFRLTHTHLSEPLADPVVVPAVIAPHLSDKGMAGRTLHIGRSGNVLCFSANNGNAVWTRLLRGRYFRILELIPDYPPEGRVAFHAKPLLAALAKAVKLLKSDAHKNLKNYPVRIEVNSDGTRRMSTKDSTEGVGLTVALPVAQAGEGSLDLLFNAKELHDGVALLAGKGDAIVTLEYVPNPKRHPECVRWRLQGDSRERAHLQMPLSPPG